MLVKLRDEFPENCHLAFADDITLMGPTDKVNEAFERCVELLRGVGLEVNRQKSLSWDGTVVEAESNGMKLLGAAVGCEAFVRASCRTTCADYTAIVPRLTE